MVGESGQDVTPMKPSLFRHYHYKSNFRCTLFDGYNSTAHNVPFKYPLCYTVDANVNNYS